MSSTYKYRKKVVYKGVNLDIKAHTEEELGIKYAKKVFEIDNAISTSGGNTLVNKWAEHYFDTYVAESVSDGTCKDRKHMYCKHARPYIGSAKLNDISASQCQDIVNRMKGFSRDRVDKMCQLLFNIFDKARKEGLISRNPAEDIERIPSKNGEGRAATMQERALMLMEAKGHKAGLWLRTILYCGFRPGETDRFKGKHINYDAGLIFIDGTKSAAAKRIVPVPKKLLSDLRSLDLSPEENVFKNTYGDQMRKSSRAKLWNSFKREMNIKAGCKVYRNQLIKPLPIAEDLVPYCFRHSFATDLKDANVPYRIRQELLGHANGSVTDRYTHRTEASLNTARELLEIFREKQDKEIEKMQSNILKNGYKPEINHGEDLSYKYFPDLF